MSAAGIANGWVVPFLVGGGYAGLLGVAGWRPAAAQSGFLSLSPGFSPNPTVLIGTGGGDRPAETVVDTDQSLTGPCLGFISELPHENLSLQAAFSNLEIRIESDLDTTLVMKGPDGVWCNDDKGSHNPAIAGAWLPGDYQIWIGAYQENDVPEYELIIRDRS